MTLNDVRDLLTLYKASEEERESLMALARQARQKGWWSAYGDVLPDDYVGFEAEAETISVYESLYVPGLLQTEEYARAIIRAGRVRPTRTRSTGGLRRDLRGRHCCPGTIRQSCGSCWTRLRSGASSVGQT